MDTIKQEIALPKEATELAAGLEKFVKACKVALADGFQPGTDLPPVLTSAMNDLFPAIQGAELVKEELKAMPAETIYVFGKAGYSTATE